MIPEGVNEDLVMWFETTNGKMRVYPVDGLWRVESYDNDTTGQIHIVIDGIELFSQALATVLGSLFNAVAVLESEKTLKRMALHGFTYDDMEEYRARAVEKAEGV